jgi:hypothetical protein
MPALLHRGPRRRTISEINMVPFIDVMLVLLIIFMVTAPLITAGVVDLPSVGKARQRSDPHVIELVVGGGHLGRPQRPLRVGRQGDGRAAARRHPARRPFGQESAQRLTRALQQKARRIQR